MENVVKKVIMPTDAIDVLEKWIKIIIAEEVEAEDEFHQDTSPALIRER